MNSLLFNEDKNIFICIRLSICGSKNMVITDDLFGDNTSIYILYDCSFSYYVDKRYEGEMSLETYCQYTNTIIFNKFKKWY